MRACECVGKYAETPYYIAGLEQPVYCAEELCWCLREHAFLLDLSLLQDHLADWLDRECGLGELAQELYSLIHRQGSLSSFVVMILEYVGLYRPEEIREVERVLKQGAGLSGIEKRKNQVDRLVRKKRYGAAIRGYDALLEKWDRTAEEGQPVPAPGVRADLIHNKAVALCGLMMYGSAAEYFREAAELDGDPAHYEAYLAAKRLSLDESGYIAFAAEQTGNYDATLALESRLEQLEAEWRVSLGHQRLVDRRTWREEDRQRYDEDTDELIRSLKTEYRKDMTDE